MTSTLRSHSLVKKVQNCIVCNAEPTAGQLTNVFVKEEVNFVLNPTNDFWLLNCSGLFFT